MSARAAPALTSRQFALVGASVLVAVLAHAPHLPFVLCLFMFAVVVLSWVRHARGFVLRRWIKLTLIAAFIAALIAEYHSLLGREPGSALACAMLVLKLLETHSRRDALAAINFASFALMSALLFDTSLVFTLATFAGVALLLAALRELEPRPAKIAEDSIPPMRAYWPPLRASLISLLLAAPLALCGFLFIPRLDSPLWRTPIDAGSRTGIGDTMSPGSVQNLLIDDSPAFRVGFDDMPPKRNQLYWRGPVLADFDGTTWRRGFHPPGAAADALTAAAGVIGYEVTLEANDQPWLFALDMPIDIPAETRRGHDMSLLRRRPVTDLLRYRMRSALSYRLDSNLPPALRKAMLALPTGFNPRALAQGRAWRNELHDDNAIVRAALDQFHDTFFYTLAAPPLGRDSVDDFLFVTKRGFCEHYASAFVVLMRAAGIPARVVTGYQGGYFNTVGNYLLVRQSDAHAWAEVWLAERGWTRVDPTAMVSPQRVEFGAQAASFAERGWYRGDWLLAIRNQFDLINRGWNTLVVQFNSQRQQNLLTPFGIEQIEPATLLWLWIGASGLLLALAAWWALRIAPRSLPPLDAAYDRLGCKLSRFAPPRGQHEGPRDYAARIRALRALSEQDAAEVQDLFDDYVNLRYARAFPNSEAIAEFARRVRRLNLQRNLCTSVASEGRLREACAQEPEFTDSK
jgi:transglutaminase-like putative cysteine protease